jgi:homoserine kinase
VDRVHVTAPASSANLGPGYDCLGVALPLRNDVVVERVAGPLEVVLRGAGADLLPADATNLVVQSFRRSSGLTGDGLRFTLTNEVPLRSGTGSSSAAIVAGLAAGLALTDRPLDVDTLLPLAIEIEGHPDNVAAAIYGGLIVCGMGDGGPAAARFDPPEGLEGIVVIPPEEVSTERAREAIPAQVPLVDAVANVSAAAMLVLGLRSADLDLLARGLHDHLHQDRRRDLYPRSMEIVDSARDLGALGATISGAGPTVLVWTTWQDAGNVAAALEQRCAGWAEVRRLPFSPLGADVPEL